MPVTHDLPDLTDDFVAQFRQLQEELASRRANGPSDDESAEFKRELEQARLEGERWRIRYEQAAEYIKELQADIQKGKNRIDELEARIRELQEHIDKLEAGPSPHDDPRPTIPDPSLDKLQKRLEDLERNLKESQEQGRTAIDQANNWRKRFLDERHKSGG